MGTSRDAREWLAIAQAQLLGGDLATAQETLARALSEHPGTSALRRAQAGVLQRIGRGTEAEVILCELFDADSGDVATVFTLASLRREQGRMAAAAAALRTCFAQPSGCRNAEVAIRAIEFLDDCDRKADAAAIAAIAIDAHPDDARLHAYAGMLRIQLGEFERARRHYLFALQRDGRAWEWHVPIGLVSAQRYESGDHPDLSLLRDGLQRDGLSENARAELHFALGKANDDIGEYAEAAQQYRLGNAIRKQGSLWSRKAWRRAVEARLAATSQMPGAKPTPGFTPIFVVGMPRSGTTLLAERLGRFPGVVNRGEQPWLARLALQPDLDSHPEQRALERAAAAYAAQVRQDDAGSARWFIDKQPLNFRYVDLALALFPDARIVRCRRDPRDNALSLWMQCFLEDVQGYSHDFNDITRVMRDCEKLMKHWQARYPDSICTIRYEDLVAAPEEVSSDLAAWIGISDSDSGPVSADRSSANAISTASLWQARQPVNTRSIGRWRRYEHLVPELSGFSEA